MIIIEYGTLPSKVRTCERCGCKFQYDITDVSSNNNHFLFGRRADDEISKITKTTTVASIACPCCSLPQPILFEEYEELDVRQFPKENEDSGIVLIDE